MSNQEFDDLIVAFVEDSIDQLALFERVLMAMDDELEEGSLASNPLEVVLRPLHTVKGNAGMLGFMTFSSAIHKIEDAVKGVLESGEIFRNQLDVYFGVFVFLRAALRQIGEDLAEPDTLLEQVEGLLSTLEDHEVQLSPGSTQGKKTKQESAVKVDIRTSDTLRIRASRVDALLVEMGELGIFLNGMQQLLFPVLQELDRETRFALITAFDRVRTSYDRAQEYGVNLRMVPLEYLFSQVPGWVRDLGANLGKNVRVTSEGADVLLDKNIVDKLQEPFVHLIRNAIDHGIENQEERELCGKSSKGTIRISARSEAGSLVVMVEDDGRGLAKDKIIAKAQQNGLIGPQETPANWEDLIFQAGFSTSSDVSEISGRGVGMDIVRSALAHMDGSVVVQSTQGVGTTFRIDLPLTLAVTEILKIRTSNEVLGIPIRDVCETGICEPHRCETHAGRTLYRMPSNELLPLYDLASLVPENNRNSGAVRYIVHVERGSKETIVLTDELLGEDRAVLRQLKDGLFDHPIVRSGAIEGDGSVTFVLDTSELVSSFGGVV